MRGTVIGERFVVEEQLDAAGDAFCGTDRSTGARVLIRRAAAGRTGRARDVVSALAGVDHPGVARPLRIEIAEDGRVVHVQELVDGATFAEELDAGPMTIERVARLGEALCSALAAVHAVGVVHGGISATNVIITDTTTTKVTDFGLVDDVGHRADDDVRAVGQLLSDVLTSAGTVDATPSDLVRAIEASVAIDPTARPPARDLAARFGAIAGALTAGAGALSQLLRDVAHIPHASAASPPMSAIGTWKSERFEIQRKLGAGGFGVVYEAFDKTRDAVVAVKTLARVDGEKLYRFKKEFRALSELVHPNLVRLYELFADDGAWFFSMELVRGVDFVSYVRAQPSTLRACLRQLVDGVAAIHAAGRLHRDLKPHNVLVTSTGDVKILDFGLVAELSPDDRQTAESAGTPAYMAPETIRSEPPTTATDWYSFGAMLYEALTGSIPFATASGRNIVVEKLIAEPPTPRALSPTAPADLDALASALLRRESSERPTLDEIRAVTHAAAVDAPTTGTGLARTTDATFVGRVAELDVMRRALADSCAAPVVVVVEGESGIGKTALVRRFLADVRELPGAAVLAGRCYEQEAVPFKAFDGVIDALSRHLQSLPPAEAASLFPRRRDALMLARLFPVLERVPAWPTAGDSAGRDEPVVHPLELRARAFAALRELFARLGERGHVVLFIDDLQWSDEDSFTLLDALFEEPHAPPLLLVGAARAGQVPERLSQVRERVALTGLTPNDVAKLATSLGVPASERVSQIAIDAGGHPLFAQELLLRTTTDAGARLDDVLWTRIERLQSSQRALLDLASLAGAPLSVDVVAAAARTSAALIVDDAASLRAARLLRGASVADSFEPYHDRVRELVVARMDRAARDAGHTVLADTLARFDVNGALLSEVVRHLIAAGDRERAAAIAPAVARQAEAALAFERAAELYALALEDSGVAGADAARCALLVSMADALTHAGHGVAAADAYLEAAQLSAGDTRTRLESRAACELMNTGHVERAYPLLVDVFRAMGEAWPRTKLGVVWSFVVARLLLVVRGRKYHAVAPGTLTARAQLRLEVHDNLDHLLGFIDGPRANVFALRALRLALDCGAETFIATALARKGVFDAAAGSRQLDDAMALIAKADEIAKRAPRPGVRSTINACRGGALLYCGRFADAAAALATAMNASADPGLAAWQMNVTRINRLGALEQMGAFRELCDGFDVVMNDSRRRGDVFAEERINFTMLNTRWLADDLPEKAREQVATLRRAKGIGAAHLGDAAAICELQIALYLGAVVPVDDVAWKRALDWGRIEGYQIELGRVLLPWFFARTELVRGASRLAAARRHAARIRKEAVRHARWRVALVDAGIAALEGNVDAAITNLQAAEACAEADGCSFFADVARLRRGQLLGGDAGAALTAAAEAAMSKQVKSPARFADLMAPGFSRR